MANWIRYGKHGWNSIGEVPAVLGLSVQYTAQAAPQCSNEVSPAIVQLIELTRHLQTTAVTFAIPFAGLMLTVSGFLWQTGSAEHQRRARRIFINTFVGLTIVILSDGLVSIVTNVLCGGGV
ncbi:hypothetical protein [Halosolutus amylolyticus]|uniref:hypothetical protein n=1 Tax=Halosolutus amylolyticus TaxID=2932267 RepID=UPI002022A271|nr:hypothetical protein [Halosolutus amylolyticus]